MALVPVGGREADDPRGLATVRDEHLRAVDHVLVAARDRHGLDAGDIGAGARLGQTEAAEERLLDERRQPLLLLLLAAGDQDRAGGQAVGADRGADPRAAEVELLADEHPLEAGQLGPAQRLRQVQVHEAHLVRLGDDVGRVGLVLVVLRRLRADLLLGELSRERAQLALLTGERERHATRDACLDRGHGCSRASID